MSNDGSKNKEKRNYRLVYDIARKHIGIFLLLVLTLIVPAAASLIIPKIQGFLIDTLVNGQKEQMIYYIKLIIMFVAAAVLGTWIKGIVTNKYRNKIECELCSLIQDNIFTKSYTYFTKYSHGYIQSRSINDVSALEPLYGISLLNSVFAVFSFIAGITILFTIDTLLTAYCLGLIPFFFVASSVFARPIQRAYIKRRNSYDKLMSMLVNFYSNIITIKTFNAISFILKKIHFNLAGYFGDSYKEQKIKVHYTTVAGAASTVAPIMVLVLGGIKVMADKMTVGDLFAFLGYVNFIYTPFSILSSYFSELNSALVALDRIDGLLKEYTDDEQGRLPLEKEISSIEFENVHYDYKKESQRDLLNNISFKVKKGDVAKIAGESGTGKTTLLKLLIEFLEPTAGTIKIDDMDYKRYIKESKFRRIMYLPSNAEIFSASLRDNVTLGYGFEDEEVKRVLTAVNLLEKTNSLEKGLDTMLEAEQSNFSDGEKQRIALGRVLLRKPDVLLIDEATNNLDQENEELFYKILNTHFKDIIVLIVAHNEKKYFNINKTIQLVQ